MALVTVGVFFSFSACLRSSNQSTGRVEECYIAKSSSTKNSDQFIFSAMFNSLTRLERKKHKTFDKDVKTVENININININICLKLLINGCLCHQHFSRWMATVSAGPLGGRPSRLGASAWNHRNEWLASVDWPVIETSKLGPVKNTSQH